MKLRKESLKKSGLPWFEPWPLALITARISFTFISSFRSSNIWISYIHNFIFIFPGYITNQFNNQLPVGLLAQLVRALHPLNHKTYKLKHIFFNSNFQKIYISQRQLKLLSFYSCNGLTWLRLLWSVIRDPFISFLYLKSKINAFS